MSHQHQNLQKASEIVVQKQNAKTDTDSQQQQVWKFQNGGWALFRGTDYKAKKGVKSGLFKMNEKGSSSSSTTMQKRGVGTVVYSPDGYGIIKQVLPESNEVEVKVQNAKQSIVYKADQLHFDIPISFKSVQTNDIFSQQFGCVLPIHSTADDIIQKVGQILYDSEHNGEEEEDQNDQSIDTNMSQLFYKGKEIKSSKLQLDKLDITPYSNLLVLCKNKQIDSIIMTSPIWIKLLFEFFGTKNVKFELMFRATRDGFAAKVFHERCNNQGPMLVIARSEMFDEPFGGYIDKSFVNANNYVKCNQGWLYSMKNQEQYKVQQYDQYGYYDYSAYGPTWGGGHDLHISDNGKNCYSNLGHTYGRPGLVNNSEPAKCSLAGKYQFALTDYEVFRVIK